MNVWCQLSGRRCLCCGSDPRCLMPTELHPERRLHPSHPNRSRRSGEIHAHHQNFGQLPSCGGHCDTHGLSQRTRFACMGGCTNPGDNTSRKPMGCIPSPIRSCMGNRPNGQNKNLSKSPGSNVDGANRCRSTTMVNNNRTGSDRKCSSYPTDRANSWPN